MQGVLMVAVQKRKFFIISLLLATCAICCEFASKGYYSRSSKLQANSIAGRARDGAQARIESPKFMRKGGIFWWFGFVSAILAFLFWVVSEFRAEPAWRLIPLGLLICYSLSQLIMV
jgi:hypothetical protein